MGREIRMVPANWEHPITEDEYGRKRAQPMFDWDYAQACADWLEDFDRIRNGGATETEKICYPNGVCDWAADNVPPKSAYYRPWKEEDATWYQAWETVSEGTPVSPPFATQEELITYLAENGDFWDQKRCKEASWVTLYKRVPGVSAWGEEAARRFVMGPAWAPSLVVQDGKVMTGVEAIQALADK